LSLANLMSKGEEKGSRLILALDLLGPKDYCSSRAVYLLSILRDYVIGVKIGHPLTLSIGIKGVLDIIKQYSSEYFFIADFKLADVPHIMKATVKVLVDMGFNAVITHLFPMSIDELVPFSHGLNASIIGVLMMSHKGAVLFEKNLNVLLDYARGVGVDGVVVGATKPMYIKLARERLNRDQLIFAPGVIRQGATAGEALKFGADFEIVGRAIYEAPDPLLSARRIVESEREALHDQ